MHSNRRSFAHKRETVKKIYVTSFSSSEALRHIEASLRIYIEFRMYNPVMILDRITTEYCVYNHNSCEPSGKCFLQREISTNTSQLRCPRLEVKSEVQSCLLRVNFIMRQLLRTDSNPIFMSVRVFRITPQPVVVQSA